jgi:uncharacterized repeat protein (TIGR03943 family)
MMRTRLWVRNLLMVLLGLYFIDTLISGRVTIYVNQNFQWLAGFAGVAFLLLGIVGIVELMRMPAPNATDALERDPKAHTHGNAPSWPVLSIIAVPLALGILVPARPLGASAVNGDGLTTSIAVAQQGGATFSIPPSERNMMDWLRSFGSSTDMSEFNGQEAEIVGFVYHDVRLNDKTQFFAMRFIVSCCVADATSIGLVVEWPDAATLQSDGWVKVTGKFQAQDVAGQEVPVLIAENVESVEQPEHPYLYP